MGIAIGKDVQVADDVRSWLGSAPSAVGRSLEDAIAFLGALDLENNEAPPADGGDEPFGTDEPTAASRGALAFPVRLADGRDAVFRLNSRQLDLCRRKKVDPSAYAKAMANFAAKNMHSPNASRGLTILASRGVR